MTLINFPKAEKKREENFEDK